MRAALIGIALAAGLVPALGLGPAVAAETGPLPTQAWSFAGLFGTFDPAARQRGFQVYKEVCAACHSLSQIRYRELGAIGFSADEIKAIAAEAEITDGPNDEGQMYQRPGRPADRFKAPFANPQAARAANSGAFPPDLSLIVKAREGGADYLHALLTGFTDPPAGTAVLEGMNYNKWFPGNQIAMPGILQPDGVTYADATKASVDQMARDVVTFLAWAAEPELEARKRLGVKVMLFLFLLTGLLYAIKRRVWKNLH